MFLSNQKQDGNVSLSIDGTPIERLFEFRYFDVIMDEKIDMEIPYCHLPKIMA